MGPSANETRQQILDVADDLFSKRGYTSVTLRDIATAVGMKHASLYYYAPGGKKQLYVEVMQRNFKRHQQGLAQAVASAGDDLRQQMYAAAHWLVSQPPLDLSRMREADMAELDAQQRAALLTLAYDALRSPIVAAIKNAVHHGSASVQDYDVAALAFVSLIQSVHNVPDHYGADVRQQVGRQLVDMLLDGWLSR
jgi:AcrR family transcriptional regulator